MNPIYVFDPTASDSLSKVRGVGRYLQVLHENFEKEFIFTNDLRSIPYDSTFINPFLNILQPPLITQRIAKKQISVIHDLIPLKYPPHFPIGLRGKLNVFRNKQTLKSYDLIITDSETSKKDITSILKIKEDKIKVIYPVVAKVFQNDKPTTNNQQPTTDYCVYVGDATWNKNLVNLAKAIKTADISCVFVGKVFSSEVTNNPWQKELRDFFKIAKNDSRFIFLGFVADSELINLYKNSICNILVSQDEGFGFSYLEAATLGVPSILSDIPVFHETASDSALFVSPNNPGEIAAGIQKMKEDHEYRKTLGQSAKKRSEFFDATRFKNDLLSICD